MTEPLIAFRNVGKTFHVEGRSVEAVRGVDLDVRAWEFVTLVGPSGCGKSTLLNMVGWPVSAVGGIVWLRGSEVTRINLKTGYMTQNDHLLPWRDVVGNIQVPLEIQGMPASADA